MSTNETAGSHPGGGWTQTPAAALSYRDCTAAATARQMPAWAVSKAGADRAWPGVRSLLVALGFQNPTPTCAALDWQGCDIVAGGVKLAWRNRARRYIGFHDVTIRTGRPSGKPTEAHKWGASDLALWTWTSSGGAVCDWLLVRCDRVTPLLAQPWPVLTMPDAQAACIPWDTLAAAGAVVTASRGVLAALG